MAEPTPAGPARYARILVVELLGGIGDLLLVLPAVTPWRAPTRGRA